MVAARCYDAMVRQRGGKRRFSGGRIADDSSPNSTPLAEADPYQEDGAEDLWANLPSPITPVEGEPQSEDSDILQDNTT